MLTCFQVERGQGQSKNALNLAGKWPQQWPDEMDKNKGKNNEKMQFE